MIDRDKFESGIERSSPKIILNIGAVAIVLDYTNTMLYEHTQRYSRFDHIFVTDTGVGDQHSMVLRDALGGIWDDLVSSNFPRLFAPYPTEQDERIITDFLVASIDEEWSTLDSDHGDC